MRKCTWTKVVDEFKSLRLFDEELKTKKTKEKMRMRAIGRRLC